jgi:5-methylcytosine-specific restriction endonuclease McrA
MACRQCGSDWLGGDGANCNRCPHCCKGSRCDARKKGLWPSSLLKVCRICGAEFSVSPNRHRATVCDSDICQKKHRNADAKVRVARWKAGLAKKREPVAPKKVCRRDGCNDLVKENRYDYCSKACAGADARELNRDFGGVPVSTRKAIQIATWFHDWHCEHQKITPCLACGALLLNTTGQRKFCDDACRHRFANPLHELCIDCGCQLNATTRCIRICKSCKKKRKAKSKRLSGKNARKRCKRHGVPWDSSVKPIKVFERDRYVCQLCGRKCLASYTVVDDMPLLLSPTVDHIVPISLGIKGHTWDNVQCACWECNVAKGATPQGQLRLAAV